VGSRDSSSRVLKCSPLHACFACPKGHLVPFLKKKKKKFGGRIPRSELIEHAYTVIYASELKTAAAAAMDGTEHRHRRSPGCTLAELPLQHGQQMLAIPCSWHRQPMGRLNRPGTSARRRRAAEQPAMARCGRARAPWVDRLTVAADAAASADRRTVLLVGRNSSPNHCVLLLYAMIDLISVSCSRVGLVARFTVTV
jgi:hypothetical protein